MMSSLQKLTTSVEKSLLSVGFLPKGTGLLLGLSGGADSVVLLNALVSLSQRHGFVLEAVHVNHMIRGNEAVRDEDFCRSLCLKQKVKLHVFTENVPKIAIERGTGLEETARDVRYGIFKKLLDGNNLLQYVVTAHNASDNIETVVFNITRGCGLRGLCGIPMIRGRVLRPMLNISKAEILEALEQAGISHIDDSTNADVRYTRNYIRRDILPSMRKINPGVDASAYKMCMHLRDDLTFIEDTAKAWLAEKGVTVKASVADLQALHVSIARRIIPHMYREAGGMEMLEEVHIDQLISMIQTGHTTFIQRFPGGICAYAEHGRIVFSSSALKQDEALPIQIVHMGENHLQGRNADLILSPDPDYFKEKSANIYKFVIKASLSSAKINGDLYVRERIEGDSYRYAGMTHKIKKLLADRRLNHIPRPLIPVLCDDTGALWVPGFSAREDKDKTEKRSLYVYYCYRGGQNE